MKFFRIDLKDFKRLIAGDNKKDVQRNVTAHELCLSYFWNIIDDHETAKRWDEDKKWAYSEILSWCLLGSDRDFYKFWPWTLEKDLFPENHEYPEILPLQRRIKEMYYISLTILVVF